MSVLWTIPTLCRLFGDLKYVRYFVEDTRTLSKNISDIFLNFNGSAFNLTKNCSFFWGGGERSRI